MRPRAALYSSCNTDEKSSPLASVHIKGHSARTQTGCFTSTSIYSSCIRKEAELRCDTLIHVLICKGNSHSRVCDPPGRHQETWLWTENKDWSRGIKSRSVLRKSWHDPILKVKCHANQTGGALFKTSAHRSLVCVQGADHPTQADQEAAQSEDATGCVHMGSLQKPVDPLLWLSTSSDGCGDEDGWMW